MMSHLELDAPLTSITALHLSNDYLISGEGPYCHLYERILYTKLSSHKIFSQSSIHGIRALESNPNKLCLFGARSLRIISVHLQNCSVALVSEELRLDDWIWDCHWLIDSSDKNSTEFTALQGACEKRHEYIVAVLGHNSIARVSVESHLVVEKIDCQQSCALYSAKVVFSPSWSQLVIVVGSVFNQLLIWSPAILCKTESQCDFGCNVDSHNQTNARVLHVLTGHNGVITSIDYNEKRSLLCSTSDDRSLRLWRVSFKKRHEDARMPETGKMDSNELKFGLNCETATLPQCSLVDWECAEFQIVHILFGHTARVWQAKILADCIVSVGEDAVCCLWNDCGKVVHRFKGHKGRSIWTVAADDDAIITGGADAGIRVWYRSSLSEPDVTSTVLTNPPLQQTNDFPRVVRMLGSTHVLVMSNNGCLWAYNICSGHWMNITQNSRYNSYSVIASHPSANMIALGNITGHICVLCVTSSLQVVAQLEEKVYSGKVLSIHWVNGESYQQHERLLLITGPDGSLKLINVQNTVTSREASSCSLDLIQKFLLPAGHQRWVTSACFISSSSSMTSLVCGDRSGSIHVFKLDRSTNRYSFIAEDIESCGPVQVFQGIHGRTGVTFICCHNNQLYSCGRDGVYNVYTIVGDTKTAVGQQAQLRLQLLRSIRVLKGLDWLTRLEFLKDDVLVLGFHSNQFVIYSVASSRQLLCIACGGGHRTWDFLITSSISSSSSNAKIISCQLVYIQSSGVTVYRATLKSSQTVIRQSLHGSLITDAKYISTGCNERQGRMIVTVGQDGKLILSSLGVDGNGVDVLSSVKAQSSSINSLAISTNQKRSSVKVIHSQALEGLRNRSVETDKSNCDGSMGNGGAGVGEERSNGIGIVFCAGSKGELSAWIANIHPIIDCSLMDVDGSTTSVGLDIKSTTANGEEGRKGAWWKHLATTFIRPCPRVKGRKKSLRKNFDNCHVQDTSETPRYLSVDAFVLSDLVFTSLESDFLDEIVCCDWLHIVIGVDSLGIVRLFCFDEGSSKFYTLARSTVHEHCLMSVTHFIHHDISTNQRRAFAVVGVADGSIRLWDITDILKTFLLTLSDNGVPTNVNSASYVQKEIAGNDNGPSIDREKIVSTEDDINSLVSCAAVSVCNHSVTNQLPHDETLPDSTNVIVAENESDDDDDDEEDEEEEEESMDNGGVSACNSQEYWTVNNCIFDWDKVPDLGRPVCILEAHQSGVNALVVHPLKPDNDGGVYYSIVSGGDDTALVVHVLRLYSVSQQLVSVSQESNKTSFNNTAETRIHITSCIAVPGAHFAQITGLFVVSDSMLASVSNDQRLTIWSLTQDSDNTDHSPIIIRLEAIRTVVVDIADVHGLDGWIVNKSLQSKHCAVNKEGAINNGYDLVVYGAGLQQVFVNI